MVCKEREALVEKLGVFLENKEQLAPVAARIMAYIILKGNAGTTFEDLVTNLCASKSTISTHLNYLADLKRLNYFTKSGDRKKYYLINRESVVQNIDKMVGMWHEELDLHKEIKAYKEKANKHLPIEEQFDMAFHDIFMVYLKDVINSVAVLRDKIINNHLKKQ
ncbi:transcriptional regulator [Gaetbulibacter saemankumensis]|uniref:transcriptional regulator n=1 Tax=Gaetbulibacter saemankumensis TaxID=311208 RepID=UPI0004124469|nr:transcriptional regulator [Gaetbulibacter saemankumensis]